MKHFLLTLTLFLGLNIAFTQTDPTLSVGLETLTYGKGTIDVELLTEIILEKQKELKQEALKRFMFNLFPNENYTTKFYLQNALHILLNEQNPEVIKKELLEILTNYSLALGFTIAYKEIHPEHLRQASTIIKKSKKVTDNLLDSYEDYKNSKNKFIRVVNSLNKLEKRKNGKENSLIKNISENNLSEFLSTKYKIRDFILKNPKVSQSKILDSIIKKITMKNDECDSIKNDTVKKYCERKHTLRLFEYYTGREKFMNKANFKDNKKWLNSLYMVINHHQLNTLIDDLEAFENETFDISSNVSLETNIKIIEGKVLELIDGHKINNEHYSYQLENAFLDNNLKEIVNILKSSKPEKEIKDNDFYKKVKNIIDDYLKVEGFINKLENIEVSYPKEELNMLLKEFEDSIKSRKRVLAGINRRDNRLKRRQYRKGIDNTSFIKEDSHSIPFNILLDVIATALSKNDTLKNKGFFKQKVDYNFSRAFNNLNPEDQKEIRALENRISNTITDYVSNYDIIKEVSKRLKTIKDNAKPIIEQLKDQAEKKANEIYSTTCLKGNFISFNCDKNSNENENINGLKKQDSSIEKLIGVIKSKLNAKQIKLDELKKQISSITHQNLTETESLKKLISSINSEIYNLNQIDINSSVAQANKEIENLTLINLEDTEDTTSNENKEKLKTDMLNSTTQRGKLSKIKINITLNEQDKKAIAEKVESLNKNNVMLPKLGEDLENLDSINEKILQLEGEITQLVNNLNNADKDKNNISNRISVLKRISEEIGISSLNFLSKKISSLEINKTNLDSLALHKFANFTKKLYKLIETIKKRERPTLKDINYLKDQVIPEIIKFKIIFSEEEINQTLDNWIILIRNATHIMYKEAMEEISNQLLTTHQVTKISELLKFIANLDHLDKAETFEHVVNLFREGNDEVNKHLKEGKFKNFYNLFANAIKKYTLVNSKEQYIELDVASFLVELEEYYDKNNDSKWGFYLGIGLSQNFFLSEVSLAEDEEPSRTIGFASEKLGVSYKILDFKRRSDYRNLVPNDIYLSNKSPFINEWYANLYGSGLLYALADATTNQNFDFAHVGIGTGIRFYNALDFSISLGFPLGENSKPLKDAFVGFGFDIPLSEYLSRSKSKKAKAKSN